MGIIKEHEGRYYTDFGIYTDMDGYYHYEELFAYGFQPYYVKTADNNHYIYLFCEGSEYTNRQMQLLVYNVKEGGLIKVGASNVAPAYIAEDTFLLPLNPECLILDDFDTDEEDCIFLCGKYGITCKEMIVVHSSGIVEQRQTHPFRNWEGVIPS